MFRRRVTRFRRRFPIRRRLHHKKRIFRRRFIKKRISSIHSFKTNFVGPVVTSGNAFAGYLIGPRVEDLPEFAEISGMFNYFRMNKVVVKFMPVGNVHESFSATPGVPAQPAQIHTCINTQTFSAPGGVASMLGFNTYRCHSGWRTFSRTFIPCLRMDQTGNPGSVPMYKKWIAMPISGDDSTPWSGLQIGIDPTGSTNAFSWQTYIKVYYSCKEKTT